MSKIQIRNCVSCNSTNEITSGGFIVCTSCGTTKDREYVDMKPSLSKEGNFKNRQDSIGKSLDFVGSLGSQIGYNAGFMRTSLGKRLSPAIVAKYRRLKNNYHEKSRLEGNATHLRTMIAFNRVFNLFSISKDIKQRALFLYWKQVNSKKRITNHILLVALCFLQAVREAGDRAPLRFSEIIDGFNKNGHRVTNKNILRLARELNVKLSPISRKSEDYIERISSLIRQNQEIKLRMKKQIISKGQYEMLLNVVAQKFLSLLNRKERGGVQPYPFAVSIIYLSDRAVCKSLDIKPVLTQQVLAKIASSAEFTIRDHVYRFLGRLYSRHESELINTSHHHNRINQSL